MNGMGEGGASAAFGMNSRDATGLPSMGLSRPPPGIGGPGFGGRFGTNTPPPASRRPPVGSSRLCSPRCTSSEAAAWQRIRLAPAAAATTTATAAATSGIPAHQRSGVNFLAELQQQAAQRAQQQAQYGAGARDSSDASRASGNASDPLLAQLVGWETSRIRNSAGQRSVGHAVQRSGHHVDDAAQVQAPRQQHQQHQPASGGNRYGAMGGFRRRFVFLAI